MLSKPEVQLMARMQLAKDLACSPRDFVRASNIVTPFQAREGRRPFHETEFLYAACFGRGTVFTADAAVQGEIEALAATRKGSDWFQHDAMRQLDHILAPHGWEMGNVCFAYLPELLQRREANDSWTVRWFEGDDLGRLYDSPGFSNALRYQADGLRPDVLAVAGYDENGALAGVAGASADAEDFWQIGIDILPEYRRDGLGTCLVNLLTARIILLDKIPYYVTGAGNIGSRSVARNCGYYPAWVEMSARPSR